METTIATFLLPLQRFDESLQLLPRISRLILRQKSPVSDGPGVAIRASIGKGPNLDV